MAVLDLEQRVASVVIAQLDSANGRIEELIERALQAELDRRVAALIETELEDRDKNIDQAHDERHASKVCSSCKQEKPVDKFERHRNVCRACRWQAERERRETKETPPAPLGDGSASTRSPAPASSSIS